jgi:hypothetical protein
MMNDPTDPQVLDFNVAAAGEARRSSWPDVIGIIGIILSVIIFVDKLDDLMTLTWTEEQWSRLLGTPLAETIVRSLPPVGWRLVSSVAQMALAVLLLSGSLALRRRRRAGISRCRTWAMLAIAWVAVEIGWAIWWLSRYPEGLIGIPAATWQGFAAFGIAVALVLLLAFPVFLLIWFSRGEVRAEYEGWPG